MADPIHQFEIHKIATLGHIGEPPELALPREMMPVASRTLFQALRSRAAAQITPDWVGPFWLERQLDPASPAFVPRGPLPFLTNVTYRNWTAIGTLEGHHQRSLAGTLAHIWQPHMCHDELP